LLRRASSERGSASALSGVRLAEQGAVFERPPQTLSFLVISSWFVPTVTNHFRGLGSWLISCAARIVLIVHIGFATRAKLDEDEFGQCSTPAVLQWTAIYVFGTQCIAEFSAIAALDMALSATRVRVNGGMAVGLNGFVRQEEPKILEVRPTSPVQRALLCTVVLMEMAIEGTLLIIGAVYLMWARTLVDLIADTVALHFIALVDDLMYAAYFSTPTKERLAKYEFERRWAAPGGSTSLKRAGRPARLLHTGQQMLSVIWLLISGLVVLIGMLHGVLRGSAELANACSFLVSEHHVRYD